MDVRQLSGSLGAEVRGVHIGAVDAAAAVQITELLTEHLVLFFPDQSPTPEQHLAFAQHFGRLEGHPHLDAEPTDRPAEIFELRATQGGIADEWHSDLTFQSQPSVMAVLHMVECPEVGGDTMWANMYRAYDELSAPLRDLCDGLTALHDASPHGLPEKVAVHPVVRVHPVTGKKSLFVNEHFTRRIVELSHDESAMLLGYLTKWASGPRFSVRYRWTAGTVALWDNRCTQHFVINDFSGERIIQRATVMGDEPRGAQPPRWEPYVRTQNHAASSRFDQQLRHHLRDKR